MSKRAAHGVGIHRPSHVSLQEWCACDGPTAPPRGDLSVTDPVWPHEIDSTLCIFTYTHCLQDPTSHNP